VRVVQEVGWGAGGSGSSVQIFGGTDPTTGQLLPRRACDIVFASGEGDSSGGGACAVGSATAWNWGQRRLEKEYIWHADAAAYVDECAAQYVYNHAHEQASGTGPGDPGYYGDQTQPALLYVLSDHNANVIGLTDANGQLRCQYSYTPYGELLAAEYFTDSGSLSSEANLAAKANRLGHQGLRMERLDRPWDGAMDRDTQVTSGTSATGAFRALAHARNRMYDPAEGRFQSVDPNGLGLVRLGSLSSIGRPIGVAGTLANLELHYGDGLNCHTSFASNPMTERDPLGLEYVPFDNLDILITGGMLGWTMDRLIERYGLNHEADIDWATDWSQGDSWYSQSGEYNYYGDLFDSINSELRNNSLRTEDFGHGPAMAGTATLPKAAKFGYGIVKKLGAQVMRTGFEAAYAGGKRSGMRFWDGIRRGLDGAINVALEIKSTSTGYIKPSAAIKKQIEQDVALVKAGITKAMEWHFVPRAKDIEKIELSPEVRRLLKWAQEEVGEAAFKVFGISGF
jgi:hypothetical protein